MPPLKEAQEMQEEEENLVAIQVIINQGLAQEIYDDYRCTIKTRIHKAIVSIIDACCLGTLMKFQIEFPDVDSQDNYGYVCVESLCNLDRAREIWGDGDLSELRSLYRKRIKGAVDEALLACGVGGVGPGKAERMIVDVDMNSTPLAISSLLEDLADDVYEGCIEREYRMRKDSEPVLKVSFA